MNIGRFLGFARAVLGLEGKYDIQGKLRAVSESLQQMMNQPQNANHQTRVSDTLNKLGRANTDFVSHVTPACEEFMQAIGSWYLFGPMLLEEIEAKRVANLMTPAVLKRHVDEMIDKRNKIIELMRNVSSGLQTLGMKEDELQPGEAQIGFLLPREIFENNLRGLSNELKFLDRVISDFTEAVEGEKREAILGDLSTTDPLITIPLAVKVAVALGGTITWMLNTYKQTLEIRQLHAKSKEMGLKGSVLKEFEKRITELIDESIEKRVAEVVEQRPDATRQAEVENALRIDIKGIASRIERGMTVDIRFLPPVSDGAEASDGGDGSESDYSALAKIQHDLKFEAITDETFLQIEHEPDIAGERDSKTSGGKPKAKRGK